MPSIAIAVFALFKTKTLSRVAQICSKMNTFKSVFGLTDGE